MALGICLAGTIACHHVKKADYAPAAQAPALTAANHPPDPPQKKAPIPDPKAKAPVPQALQVDPAGELILRVEKEYEAGQENYRAGHLEAAKQSFDSAFNLLLGSGLDVSSDDRLQKELDRILDGINGLELLALQQGDGFTPSLVRLKSFWRPNESAIMLAEIVLDRCIMTMVTAVEAQAQFGQLLKRVGRGEEVVITRRARPVARLIAENPRDLRQVRKAVARLRRLSKSIEARCPGAVKLSLEEIKSAVAEGRR